MKYWTLIAFAASVSLSISVPLKGQAISPPEYFSDEDALRLIILNLEQAIRDQDILSITDNFNPVFQAHGKSGARFDLWADLKDIFAHINLRNNEPHFIRYKPDRAGILATWDYSIQVDQIDILNTTTARVRCLIRLDAGAETDEGLLRARDLGGETILFKKKGDDWFIIQANNMLHLNTIYSEQ